MNTNLTDSQKMAIKFKLAECEINGKKPELRENASNLVLFINNSTFMFFNWQHLQQWMNQGGHRGLR